MKRSVSESGPPAIPEEVRIVSGITTLAGNLEIPPHAIGLVLFAHGSGSSRHSPRNQHVAKTLRDAGLATLLIDLLTGEEERRDAIDGALRFDIDFLAARLTVATQWALQHNATAALRIGYFGASTGAAAALVAAAAPRNDVGAIVSRGGRPDLAAEVLPRVSAPTLLIVGGEDTPVIALNEDALRRLHGVKQLEIVPGASHLFEEPGTLDVVAYLAARWFFEHLPAQGWHP